MKKIVEKIKSFLAKLTQKIKSLFGKK